MRYTVVSGNNRNFEVLDERGQVKGSYTIDAWKPRKIHVTTMNGDVFDIKTAGFWQSSQIISRNGIPYAELKYRAFKGYKLSIEDSQPMRFKAKSIWTLSHYVLVNEAGSELASISSKYSWKRFSFLYDIEINDQAFGNETSDNLAFIMIYCARVLRSMATAALVPIVIIPGS